MELSSVYPGSGAINTLSLSSATSVNKVPHSMELQGNSAFLNKVIERVVKSSAQLSFRSCDHLFLLCKNV